MSFRIKLQTLGEKGRIPFNLDYFVPNPFIRFTAHKFHELRYPVLPYFQTNLWNTGRLFIEAPYTDEQVILDKLILPSSLVLSKLFLMVVLVGKLAH